VIEPSVGSTGGAEVRALEIADPLAEPRLLSGLTRDYLIWDAFVAGARRVDLHPVVLVDALHRSAVATAEHVARTIGAIAARAHVDPAERARYGLHEDVLRLARASYEAKDDAALVRVDLLLAEDGSWQACEINADCPGGHNEALGLPRLAREAGFTGGTNPTRVVDALVRRIKELATDSAGNLGAVALVYATAYAEDLQVCALIQRALEKSGVVALLASPTAPRLASGAITVRGVPVRVLYRFFPAEYMEGQRNLGELGQAIASGALRTISSFSNIFAQSKLAFARAWALADAGILLHAELDAIPATWELADVARDVLVGARHDWVIKRAFGRVGDEVFVGPIIAEAEWPALVDWVIDRASSAPHERWIAQRFVRQRPIPTPWGPRFLTLGAYVLDGQFVGYFSRVTPEPHVSHGALCLPVFGEAPKRSA
jgi:Glutathionylspermidine synthase preATP-grasp